MTQKLKKRREVRMTKVLSRALSNDERLMRFHRQLEHRSHERWKLARIECERDGVIHVLQITAILTSPHGFVVRCQ